ncbi:MAG: ABC transporter permease [Gemmatimonadota bacterium]|nr:ABC transporter permease [Gemmatimonadota bacterium]MDH4348914.1 ABC transporter permease [Gemmatimonadota bacterium]MDH5283911.1 ABC transporter permease [Gemmatimonadota bacterium]
MSAISAIHGIVARDLQRAARQKSRMLGGLARPFIWLLLIGGGYGAIARVDGGSYHAFVFPGVVAMAVLFGGMLTAISTVYDREFGMLRLMLASPAGVGVILAGRTLSAALVGGLQGLAVLACAPFLLDATAGHYLAALGALSLSAVSSGALGLLVASRLRSVENFAGVINVVLFPLFFLSGALYPLAGVPSALRTVARVNPVTYQVDLMRHALGQGPEFGLTFDLLALLGSSILALALAGALFDPERRFLASVGGARR